jgi:RNA polymerase sigma-70 factor, ECF subfamily
MLDHVQGLPLKSAQFEARISDLENIEELVRVYRSSVLRHAYWLLKDKDLAETVTQDCFMRAFQSRALYRGQCSVRTWLLTIATNLVRDHTRTEVFRFWKQAHSSSVDAHAMENRLASHRPTVEAAIFARETLQRIWATVARLPAKQRTIFTLRFAQEMQVSEIADFTGTNANTVKSILYRAIRTVRAAMALTPAT